MLLYLCIHMHRFNRTSCFISLLILFLIIQACSREHKADERTVFRYNESKGIASLDPAFASNQTKIWPINQLFNGLVQLDEKLRIQPSIARNWAISEDGKNYEFILRKDVTFHNHFLFMDSIGRKVVASDFEYSLKRLADPATASPGAWVMNHVARSENGSLAVGAVNDTILRITLREPFPAFISLLSMHYCSVVPFELIDYYGKEFRANPVGTGPFKLKLWREGEKLILIKNHQYFEVDEEGERLPYIDAVAITFIKDKQSEFLEFIKGNLDFLSGVHPSYKDELLTRDGQLRSKYLERLNYSTHPYLNTEYLGFMLDETKLDSANSIVLDRNVRMAINHGFDRKKMIAFMRNNLGIAALAGFVPEGLPSYSMESVDGYDYNPGASAEYLRKAGYPGGVGLPVIQLTTNSDYLDLCEYIQHQLGQLGIRIAIEVGTGATFREMVANSKLPFFRGSWIADYADAQNYLSLFYSRNKSPQGPNYPHFESPEYDRIYDLAMKTRNDSIRWKLYQQLDQMIIDEAAVVPLFYDMVVRFSKNNISGLGSNAMNLLSLKKVRIDNDPDRR